MLVSRPGVSPRMIGRRRQVAELDRLIEQAQRQRAPEVALVTGEAGVGKTRLLRELVAQVPNRTRVLVSQAHEAEAGGAFAVVRDAVEAHLPADGAVPAELERWAHPLGHLLAPLVPLEEHPQDGHVHGQDELARAAVALVGQLVADGPAVVAFEDLHWADAESLEVFGRLARSELPALLVGTFRPEDYDRRHALAVLLANLERQRPVVHLPVERLTHEELAEFLEVVSGQPAERAAVDRLHQRTGGNPFFVEELLATVWQQGAAGAGTRVPDAGGLAEAPLPWNTREAVLRRLDAYDEATVAVLRNAAVLGERFELPLLAAVCGAAEDELAAVLQGLVHSGMLVETGPDVLAFRHVLVREAIARELLTRDRRAVHERALAWLVDHQADDPEVAAYHAAEAGREGEAAAYAAAAADRALHGGAPRNALWLAERALEHGDGDARLHRLASRAAAQVGELEVALRHARRWAEVASGAGDPTEEARALCQLGWLQWGRAGPDRAWEALRAATSLAPQIEPAARAEVAAMHALVLAANGQATDAVEEADRAIGLAEQVGDRRTLAHALVTKSTGLFDSPAHQSQPFPEDAQTLMRRAYAESAAVGDVETQARALQGLLLPDQSAALAMDEAAEIIAEAKDLADRYGLERFAGKIAVIEAHLNFREGRQPEVERALAAAARAALSPVERPWRARLEGDLALEQDDPARARRAQDEQRDVGAERSSAEAALETASTAAALAAYAGDPVEAEAALRRAGENVGAVCPCAAADWWVIVVAAAAAGVEPTVIRELSDRHEPPRIPRHAGLIAYAEGCLHEAAGVVDLARDRLEQAVAAPRNGRPAALMADAHRRLAELLARAGDRTAARTHVDAGLRLLTDWPGVRRDALHALQRRIGEPEQPADALFTPRERAVVELLAQGCSNSEIAERLFVARKTVSTHVSNILAKTGFERRTQVAAWAIQEGLVERQA